MHDNVCLHFMDKKAADRLSCKAMLYLMIHKMIPKPNFPRNKKLTGLISDLSINEKYH